MRQGLYSGHKRALYFYEPISMKRLDPDARAYLNAVKRFDQVGNSRCINYLVKALKAINAFQTNFVINPCYGGNPACSFNIANINDVSAIGGNINANNKVYIIGSTGGDGGIAFRNVSPFTTNNESIIYLITHFSSSGTFFRGNQSPYDPRLYMSGGVMYHKFYNNTSSAEIFIQNPILDKLKFFSYTRINNNNVYVIDDTNEYTIAYTPTGTVPIPTLEYSVPLSSSNVQIGFTMLCNITDINIIYNIKDILLTYYELK